MIPVNETRIYIRKIFYFCLVLFLILGIHISFIMGVESGSLTGDPDNPRSKEDLSRRGKIFSRSGQLLAYSRKVSGEYVELFPLGKAAAPLLGYLDPKYGKAGLEQYLDKYLLSPRNSSDIVEYIARYRPRGENVYLTIDHQLQKISFEALQGKRGAVVVINPQNGEVLALASSPGFSPKNLEQSWEKLIKDKNAPLLLRPVNGSYPPGSVFKLFVYAACLEEELVKPDTIFYCSGDFAMEYPLGTYHIREAGGFSHSSINCEDAIVHSCNVTFAQLGLKLGQRKFVEYAERFGFTSKPDFPIPILLHHFPEAEELTDTLLAQSAFGQGELSLSPMQIAFAASAFATGGKIYQPHLVKSRVDEKGRKVFQSQQLVWKNPISSDTALKVKEAMIETVKRGTGYRAQIDGIAVAGKTGSAENPSGDTHAWFVCFATAEKPEILVTVIVENGGAGGVTAAPIAKLILEKALKRKK